MKGRRPALSGPRRIFVIIGLFLLLALLVVGGYLFLSPRLLEDKQETAAGSEDWMARLPGHLLLNKISVPGTHDSATAYVQMAYFAQCQSQSIGAQLQAGFRYLDIRLAVEGEKLVLTHGSMRCKKDARLLGPSLYLEDVIAECRDFLEAHPAETILFAVKQEDGEEKVSDFQSLLHRYIQTAPAAWLLTDQIPTLEEARGKMVLLRRYSDEARIGAESGLPFLWEDQGNTENVALHIVAQENPGYTLWVQDRYQYEADDKWTAFTEGLKNAPYEADTVALHFLSTRGSGTLGRPYDFARELNQRLSLYENLPNRVGWVILDFGTAPLAAKIYERNFP